MFASAFGGRCAKFSRGRFPAYFILESRSMTSPIRLPHPRPTCLRATDFSRILAGEVVMADVRHLERCPRCRAGLTALTDVHVSHESARSQDLRLAAATVPWQDVTFLQTSDGTLTCDLLLQRGGRAELTVVAEESVWGDQVVIWPGPGIPQFPLWHRAAHCARSVLQPGLPASQQGDGRVRGRRTAIR